MTHYLALKLWGPVVGPLANEVLKLLLKISLALLLVLVLLGLQLRDLMLKILHLLLIPSGDVLALLLGLRLSPRIASKLGQVDPIMSRELLD